MKIIESFIKSKYNIDSLCEDGLFINENYVAVIDGVTAKGKLLWDGKTSGCYAKELLSCALSTLNGSETCEQVLHILSMSLYEKYKENLQFFEQQTEERLRATVVIYSIKHKQIWSFGDCQYIINGKLYKNEMKIDLLLAELRSVYLRLEILSGKTINELCLDDPSHNIIFPIIKKQLYFSNCNLAEEYMFSVLDGFCNDFTNAKIVDIREGSEIVLASDGYPKLALSLDESERYLTQLKNSDPLCIKEHKSVSGFTNGKSSIDDRTYIRFIT